jgi:hypothetical protein
MSGRESELVVRTQQGEEQIRTMLARKVEQAVVQALPKHRRPGRQRKDAVTGVEPLHEQVVYSLGPQWEKLYELSACRTVYTR